MRDAAQAPVRIETAALEHIPQIRAIEELSFKQPWSEESFRNELADSLARYAVALSPEAEVVGYCGYWSIVGEAHITNVAVHPLHRGRGVGRALMGWLLSDAAENGISSLTLEVREDNEPALRLYESLGFQRYGIRKNYYQIERKNAIIMWKHI